MKKWFFLGAIGALIFVSCKKDDTTGTVCTATTPTTVAPDSQKVYLQTYLAANNITNAVEKNGMFYVINTQGTGAKANVCSTIEVSYISKFIKGTIDGAVYQSVEAWNPVRRSLSLAQDSWKFILPLLNNGGTVTMYIPPSLGYGISEQVDPITNTTIPANSYLKVQVSMLGFQ